MVKKEKLEIKDGNIDLLNQFITNAGVSLKTFRYFEKRNLDIIKNHLVTNILIKDRKAIGYGHLEKENNNIWLGIAIVESQLGKGYGLFLINSLIKTARKLKLEVINLSVDKVNYGAISLYEKVGFIITEEMNEKSLLMKLHL